MRHFDFLDDADRARLFLCAPESFDARSEPEFLATALGATLYCPATRPKLSDDIGRRRIQGVTSMVVCLEDSIPDHALLEGERNAVMQLRHYASTRADGPLLFVRVRTPDQIPMIVDRLANDVDVLTGFVVPKFGIGNAAAYLDEVVIASARARRPLYAMPVLEAPEIGSAATRIATLTAISEILARYRDHVLAVRLGATDLSGLYALRRLPEHTAYDVALLAAVIGDAVNVLGRADEGHVITGPVWEYYSGSERIFKPLLRESPFVSHDERTLRAELLAKEMDGLIREVSLDRANGLTGKTVIHPSHVAVVNALAVVTHEEYQDAVDVLGTERGGGVTSSTYRNKMNESKPHAAWARRTVLRSRAFGVAHAGTTFVDLLAASLHQ
ncbi:MAG TPA: HpcH/HpaI aldolase/citrate lyase family protein [Jatrophihabitans sp.]|jgi:citrate lyase beta subunit